jgi:signal transduction histidine kinase
MLALLGTGDQHPAEIADALGLPPQSVRRHLTVLEASAFVKRNPDDGQRFSLDQRNMALLNASFLSLQGKAGLKVSAETSPGPQESLLLEAPSPPEACLHCQNSSFVWQMLENLDRLLANARQYQARLHLMSSQVLAAHEEERKRIARDLHDDTAQALTSLLVRLRLMERSAEGSDVRESLEELRQLTADTLEGVRRMAVDLRPTALDDLGLVAALDSFTRAFSQRWPVKVSFSAKGLRRRVPPNVELVLYRVVQEALYNVAKHAQASTTTVRLNRTARAVTAIIEDDGRGFDVAEVMNSGDQGLGLFGMQERLGLIGGSLHIDSRPDQGTRIVVSVPDAPGKRSRQTP